MEDCGTMINKKSPLWTIFIVKVLRLLTSVHNKVVEIKECDASDEKRCVDDWFSFFVEACQLTVLKLFQLQFGTWLTFIYILLYCSW